MLQSKTPRTLLMHTRDMAKELLDKPSERLRRQMHRFHAIGAKVLLRLPIKPLLAALFNQGIRGGASNNSFKPTPLRGAA